jgi:glutamate-ammonia-ligase adenylyltransferase
LVLEGHNVKLGLGGIREIEFFTQTRQLIAGGRDARLQERGTLAALGALRGAGWIPQETQTTLSGAYLWLRDVEHRLQMVQDAQTHSLPQTEAEFARLAAFMDMDVGALRARLTETFATVDTCTSAFFTPSTPAAQTPDLPFSADALAQVERWQTYPALRSERANGLFTRLKPQLLSALGGAGKPDEALFSFDGFLSGLPSGVQVFSLFASNPHLIDLIVDICATAPDLARYLSRNAKVLDAVIGGDFFAQLPDRAALRAGLEAALAQAPDYEGQLDAARRWQQEAHFRIGVHMLRGTIDAGEAGSRYADLAEATVQALWPAVLAQFEAKHGGLPGQGAAVIAMGSLGARRLTARSDLDLIVIYDAPEDGASDGPRPLAPRLYFQRLTQALITAITAPTGAGRLYEVDMRLRPSGRQGPVATSLASFDAYQRDEAWVWEHLALTRARVIVGRPGLADKLEAIRCEVLEHSRFTAEDVRAALVDMRARFIAAGRTGTEFATKSGPGRMQEIELIGQANALIAGRPVRSTRAQLSVAQGLGTPEALAELAMIYAQLADYQQALRLLTSEDPDPEDLGQGGLGFILRLAGPGAGHETGHGTGQAALADLKTSLTAAPTRADAIITELLAAPETGDR